MTMAKGTELLPGEKIELIKLSDIFADTAWNVRSVANMLSEEHVEGETVTGGMAGLRTSLETEGQDTPVIVRPSTNITYTKKIPAEPYTLVSGFRRYEAFKGSNTDENVKKAADLGKVSIIPGVTNGYIKAIVRNLDDRAARLLNVRENTGREQLDTPDLMLSVIKLSRDNKMTQVDIAKSVGIAQSYVSQLAKVGLALNKEIFNHWRDGGTFNGLTVQKRVPYDAIKEVSEVNSDRQADAYMQAIQGKAEDSKTKKWWLAAQEKAEKQGIYIGGLAKAGLFNPEKVAIDWFELVVSGKLIGKLNKKITTKKQKDKLASIAEKSFIKEWERDEAEVEEEEAEDEAAE